MHLHVSILEEVNTSFICIYPHFILVCIGGRSLSRNDARNFKLILTLIKAYIFRLHICTCNRCVAISFSIYTVQCTFQGYRVMVQYVHVHVLYTYSGSILHL